MMIIFYMKPNEHHRNKFHKYYDAPYGMMHEVGGNLKKFIQREISLRICLAIFSLRGKIQGKYWSNFFSSLRHMLSLYFGWTVPKVPFFLNSAPVFLSINPILKYGVMRMRAYFCSNTEISLRICLAIFVGGVKFRENIGRIVFRV